MPFSDNNDKFQNSSYAICYFSFHGQVKSSIADYAQMDPEAEGYPGNNVGKGSQNLLEINYWKWKNESDLSQLQTFACIGSFFNGNNSVFRYGTYNYDTDSSCVTFSSWEVYDH